jgi:hypothetical protein
MRNMAFSLTTAQVRSGTKTVTRRLGWSNLRPGDEFCAIEKGMGLKKGEKVVRLARLRCVSNDPEPLTLLIVAPTYGAEEARREGFPHMTGREFVDFFCNTHRGCTGVTRVNRIEFEYVQFLP